MTNKEFLLEVQKSCHIEMPRCLMLMGCLQKMLGNAAVDQIAVVLSGLGVFTSHKHPEYVQENPETGIMTLYPPRITYHLQSEQSVEGTPCAELLSEFAHVEADEATVFVDAVVKTVNSHLQAGEEIEMPGVGTFKNVVAHHTDLKHIDFLPCDQMKDLVNAPFSCFEAMEIGGAAEATAVKDTPAVEETIVEESTEQEVAIEEKVATAEEVPVIVENEKENNVPQETVVETPEEATEETTEEIPEETPEEETVPIIESTKKEETAPVEKEDNKPIIIDKGDYIIVKDNSSKKKDESNNWILYTSLALILLGCGFLVWLMFGDSFSDGNTTVDAAVVETVQQKKNPALTETPIAKAEPVVEKVTEKEEKPVVETATKKEEKPAVETATKKEEKPVVEQASKKEEKPVAEKAPAKPARELHRMKNADGQEVKVTLQAGSRLTLVALEHFGDKAFWPYIFEVNSDRLKAPNLVKSGMVLYLPDPAFYDIDAKDPASVQKAKNKAAQLLK